MSLREGIKSGGCVERGLRDNKGSSGNCQVTCTSSGKVAGTGRCFLGNDRGTGNTMCFQPGVRWGMGVVLHFDTRTLTITSRGFYAVFGLTPDGVGAQNSNPYHTRPLVCPLVVEEVLVEGCAHCTFD